MKLSEALQDISKKRYYNLSGYTYCDLNQCNHSGLTFDELPHKMKVGLIKIIKGLYKVQKTVYSYDIDFVRNMLKQVGINIRAFYKSCGLKDWFYYHPSLKKDYDGKLTAIRLGIVKLINRLFTYILE